MSRAQAHLQLRTEITPTRFAEVGRPTWIRQSPNGGVVAVCSAFDLLFWPGRAIYPGQALRNRVSLYAAGLGRRLALFDHARFPINDITFHPTDPRLLIATGSYDGGYSYEGELLSWNWETGAHHSVLSESREVVACRFLDARRVELVLRPRDEEEFEDRDASTILIRGVLDDLHPASGVGAPDSRLASFERTDQEQLGLERDDKRIPLDVLVGFEARQRVWDVAWLDGERIAAVHDACEFEVWRLPHGRERRERSVPTQRHGVQLLPTTNGLLIHVLELGARARSTLMAYRDGQLVEHRAFETACTFSVDRHGRLLARDTGAFGRTAARHDQVLSATGSILFDGDLGHYDCFNHFVRLDGGDALYFLRGTPPSSHQGKQLCAFGLDGHIEELMRWDDHTAHLMDGATCFGPDGSIIRGYRIHDSRPMVHEGAIERYSLRERRPLWRVEIDADVTALTTLDVGQRVVFALTNGRFGVIDTATGALLQDERLIIDGAPTFATALAGRESRLLMGTIDGRLLLWD